MKVCTLCGEDIDGTKDGENRCQACEQAVSDADFAKARQRKERARKQRRERDQVMRDLGMVKVRGAMGGTYWE